MIINFLRENLQNMLIKIQEIHFQGVNFFIAKTSDMIRQKMKCDSMNRDVWRLSGGKM
jgi:intracellular sulfur oxidation DsrE/DsrF family protein